MSIARMWRRGRVAVGATAAVLASVALVPSTPASAAVTGTIAISTPVGGLVAADTEKQVIIFNVTSLVGNTISEDTIESIDIHTSDTACKELEFYIVTAGTSVAVKTPTGGCDATSGVASETVAIHFVNGDTLTKTLSGLVFVPPPKIEALANAPLITDNSSLLTDPDDRIKVFQAAGAQTIRVKAASDFTFSGAAGKLSASLNGKALTEVKVWKADGSGAFTGTSGDNGNYFTGKTATGMTTGDATLSITHNGVTKSFLTAATGATVAAVPTVTSLSPTFGKSGAETTVTVTGTNLTAATGVTFCGLAGSAPVVASNGTSLTSKTPAAIADASPGLGTGNLSGVCPVKVTNANGTSILTAGSVFSFLTE